MDLPQFCERYGLRIFPLAEGEKRPLAKSRGVDEARKDYNSSLFKQSNLGIAGGRGLAVIDFDPRNYSEETKPYLEKLEQLFPDTISVDTASGGKHFYYEYDSEINVPSFDICKGIQLIADRKYVVGPGSRIGDKVYTFTEDLGPQDVDMERLPDWILDVVEKRLSQKAEPVSSVHESSVTDRQWTEIESAVYFLNPDMEEPLWRKIACALHSTGHPKAFELFEDWSKQGKKFVEGECVKKWNAIHGEGVTYLTIFKMATEAGWTAPKVEIEGIENWEYTKKPDADYRTEPTPLPPLPGKNFSEFVGEIYKAAPYKLPRFSIHAALAIISYHAQSRFLTPTGAGLGLYQVIHAQSADGKGFYTQLIDRNCEGIIGSPSSGNGLKHEISEKRNCIYSDSELGGNLFFKLYGKEKSPQAKQIMNAIIDCYDLNGTNVIKGSVARTAEYKSKNLKDESFSIFGSCTTQDISSLINDEGALTTGFLNRFILIQDESYFPTTQPKFTAPLLFNLDERFIQGLPEPLDGARMSLHFDEEKSALWSRFMALKIKYRKSPTKSMIIGRVHQNALRIASLIHLFERTCDRTFDYRNNSIPEEILNWSFDLAVKAAEDLFGLIQKPKPTKEERIDTLGEKFLAYLATCDGKTAPIRDVYRKYNIKRPEAYRIFGMLEELGEVEILKKSVKLT
jgi:hypothetical protein